MAVETPNAAIEKMAQIHDHYFFTKLASGPDPIQPKTEAEYNQLIALATDLRGKYDANLQKQASAGNPFLSSALDALRVDVPGARSLPAYEETQIKSAAAQLVQQDEFVQAALDYNDWLSKQVA